MSDKHDDGFDFLRKMWGAGPGLPGVVTPTLDPAELERRIKDLKAVEGWLQMNLGMLQMTIQGLEVQRATLAAMKAMSEAQEAGQAAPFQNPAFWAWPFAATPDTPAATEAAEEASEPPPGTQRSRKR